MGDDTADRTRWEVQADKDQSGTISHTRSVRVLEKLPTGWSQEFSKATKQRYYWHEKSHTSRWELPGRLDVSAQQMHDRARSALLARLSRALDVVRDQWRHELRALI